MDVRARHRHHLLAIVTFLGIGPPGIAEQAAATLEGYVEDSDGGRLPGVALCMARESAGECYWGVSDIDGSYVIRDVPPADDYAIKIDHPGFTPVEVTPLGLAAGQRLFQLVTLSTVTSGTTIYLGGRNLDDEEARLYLSAEVRIEDILRSSAGSPTIDEEDRRATQGGLCDSV